MIHAQSILLVKMSYIGALGWKTLTETLKYQSMFFGSDDTNIDGRWTIASCSQSWWKSENSNFSTWWNVLYLGRFLSCLNKQGALCRIHHVGVWCTPCLESSLPKKKKKWKTRDDAKATTFMWTSWREQFLDYRSRRQISIYTAKIRP